MKLADLTAVVDELTARVAALEAGRPRAAGPATADLAIVQSIIDELDDAGDGIPDHGTVRYAGAGHVAGSIVAWQMDRQWGDLTGVDASWIARVLGALGNPQRLRVVQLLLTGPLSTAELSARLDEPSSGQLFHHLKELLAAAVIYQPERGTYAIRQQHIVPLLTVISCALDLASSTSPD